MGKNPQEIAPGAIRAVIRLMAPIGNLPTQRKNSMPRTPIINHPA
jgi:hypothetical protein